MDFETITRKNIVESGISINLILWILKQNVADMETHFNKKYKFDPMDFET